MPPGETFGVLVTEELSSRCNSVIKAAQLSVGLEEN